MTDFTHKNLGDVEDMAAQGGFSEFQEARFAGGDLGLDLLGVSYQVVKPGSTTPSVTGTSRQSRSTSCSPAKSSVWTTTRSTSSGWTRFASATVTRGFEAGADGLELLVFGERMPGDAEIVDDFFDEPARLQLAGYSSSRPKRGRRSRRRGRT